MAPKLIYRNEAMEALHRICHCDRKLRPNRTKATAMSDDTIIHGMDNKFYKVRAWLLGILRQKARKYCNKYLT